MGRSLKPVILVPKSHWNDLLLLAFVADRPPDDDLADAVLLDIDDVDGAILCGKSLAGLPRFGLQTRVTPGCAP